MIAQVDFLISFFTKNQLTHLNEEQIPGEEWHDFCTVDFVDNTSPEKFLDPLNAK